MTANSSVEESLTSSLVRKSERLKNSPETSTAQRKTVRAEDKNSPTVLRRSERGNSQSPLKSNKKYDESSRKSDAEARSQRVNARNSEDVGTKRKKFDGRCFMSLFGQNKKNCVSTETSEKPTLLGTLAQSNCLAPKKEAEDKRQSVCNQRVNKLKKKSEKIAKDPELRDRIIPEIQNKELFDFVKKKPSEHDFDPELLASRCKGNPVALDLSAVIELDIQSGGVLTDFDKDRPKECETEAHACVQEDRPLSLSHDNRGSTQNVESEKVEVSDETRVKSKNEAAIFKENSMLSNIAVDGEETIHSRESDEDFVSHISPVSDRAQAFCSSSANVSHGKNVVKDLIGRSASAPRNRRFIEYWVPARLSNLQLEQYCAALLANSVSLCSTLKNDPVGAIRNLLITLRKVCNHPFLVDLDLSSSLLQNVKETDYLDVLIKASGKLQLLETLLLEIKKRGLRVLILYESSVYARDTIGVILDDFLLQRYGQDSFEHIDGRATVPSKKQAAVNKFNDKESGRFLFLLEIRACVSSIKLSSLDSIVIFNSDWNPVNDIRALQKVVLDSQHDQMNIIRLFSPLTVEENAMLLSKHNVIVDNSMHNISRSHSDKLLIRGVSDLFHELEKFHAAANHFSGLVSSLESSLLQDVAHEFISVFLDSSRQMGDGLSVYLKVKCSSEGLGKFRLVADEFDTLLTEERWPHDFWSKLLTSRSPQWKFVPDSNKRKRKTVHYNESEDVKRLSKVVNDCVDATSASENQNVVTSDKDSKCAKDVSQVIPKGVCIPSELHIAALESGTMLKESSKLHDTKKSLHLLLKPELQKLCELLHMSEDVKKMAERFLEYVVQNHHVTREPVTLLQAFQISVCWIAASIRTQKISCQDSLSLARKHLNFSCTADDTDYTYLKMILLKELFIQSTMDDMTHTHSSDVASPFADTSEIALVKFNSVTSDSKSPRVFDTEKLMLKIIRQINKKRHERMKLLTEKQRRELEELQKSSDEEKQQLDKDYKVEIAVVRTIHIHNSSMAAEKLKALEDQHLKRLVELENHLIIRSKSLEQKHSSEKDKENELTSCWKEDIVKEQIGLLQKLSCYNLEDGKRISHCTEQLSVFDSLKECRKLEDQEVLKSQSGALADSIGDCQSTTPDEVLALPPATSEAGNNFGVVDSAVSSSATVQTEKSASISSDAGQVGCGEAANFVDLTSDIATPESSSVDVLPLKPNNSALKYGLGPEKTLDCQTTSQEMSQSAVNPCIDVPLALSNGKTIGVPQESEPPSLGHSVPLPLSLAAIDKEVGNSSLVSSLEGDHDLPPSQLNFESGFEQFASHNKLGQSMLQSITDHANIDPTEKAVHQLPTTEKQSKLLPSTIAIESTQSQLDSQLLYTATGFSNVNPTAAESVVRPPAIEGQPQFTSSSDTPRTENSDRDIQLELLSQAATVHFNIEPSTAEAMHLLPITKGQQKLPHPIITPRCEQDNSDIQLDESLLHSAGYTNVESSAPGAVHQSSDSEREVRLLSQQSHSNMDHSLLNNTTSHLDPSAGEAVQLLPATESIIAPGPEQSHSGIKNCVPLPQIATDHCSIDLFPAEPVHQLLATEEQVEVPSAGAILRSGQSDSDNQLDNSACQTTTDQYNVEPPAGEAASQLPHSPLVDSSSSQPQSSLPVSEKLPGGGIGTTLNTDAPNHYPSPYVVGVPCISPASIAITLPLSSRPIATNAMCDSPTNLIPGTSVVSTESVCMPSISYLDPLQSELVRVQKEADHYVKEYEEMKQMLNSECEKEIKDIRAQILKKYEMQFVELDEARKCKKRELDVYRSKVYMNKMLAEYLRNKSSEPKVFVHPGVPQDNVQHQLCRHPPESAPRPPVILNTSQAAQSLGNSQGTHSSVPLRHPELGCVSAAGPISRNVQSTLSPFGPVGHSAAALQNSVCAGGPSSSSLQNSVHPGSPSATPSQNYVCLSGLSAASSQNYVRYGGHSAAFSRNYVRPGVFPVASSPNPMRPGPTTGIPPETLLPRSAALSPSGLPSTNPVVSLLPRPTGTSPIVQQATPRPVQKVNHPAPLFSSNSTRPVSTTSTAAPTVNLHSVSGIRAPAPHLRSRMSQPVAPSTAFPSRIQNSTTHPTYSNVSLPASTVVNQYQRATASHTPSDIQNGILNCTVSDVSHSQTVERRNAPPQTTLPPTSTNNGGVDNLPSTTGSTNQKVVCLSDSE